MVVRQTHALFCIRLRWMCYMSQSQMATIQWTISNCLYVHFTPSLRLFNRSICDMHLLRNTDLSLKNEWSYVRCSILDVAVRRRRWEVQTAKEKRLFIWISNSHKIQLVSGIVCLEIYTTTCCGLGFRRLRYAQWNDNLFVWRTQWWTWTMDVENSTASINCCSVRSVCPPLMGTLNAIPMNAHLWHSNVTEWKCANGRSEGTISLFVFMWSSKVKQISVMYVDGYARGIVRKRLFTMRAWPTCKPVYNLLAVAEAKK